MKGLDQSVAFEKAGAKVYRAGMIGEEGGILLETCASAGAAPSIPLRAEVK